MPDNYDGEQDEPEDDEVHETDLAAFPSTSGEDPEADDALAEALQLDVVAMIARQRFSGKGKGKCKGKGKARGKGKNKGSNLSSEERKKRLAELKSRTTLGRRRHLFEESQERLFAAATGARVSGSRKRNTMFRPRLARRRYVCSSRRPGRSRSHRCQRHSGGDTAEGTARCATTTETHRVSF